MSDVANERPGASSGVKSWVNKIGWNAASQLAAPAIALVVTPYLLHAVGADAYGVWALLMNVVTILAALDGGTGASLLRFFGLHLNSGEEKQAGRLLTTSVAFFVVIGIVFGLIGATCGSFIVHHLLNVPRNVQANAISVVQYAGPMVALPMIAGILGSAMQASGKFKSFGLISIGAQAIYAVLAVTLTHDGHGIVGMFLASVISQGLLIVVATITLIKQTKIRPRMFMRFQDVRGFASFSLKMQATSITSIVNLQSDALIVAAFLPIRYVGYFTIGNTVSRLLRNLPLNAMPALMAHLTASFAASGPERMLPEVNKVQRRWVQAVCGIAAVSVGPLYFAVVVWLGKGYEVTGLVAATLALGNGLNLCTGILSLYVRVIGRPGLETRYGAISSIVNIGLTLPLTYFFGIVGLVVATEVGQIIGSLAFIRICNTALDQSPRSFLRDIPVVKTLGTAAITTAIVGLVSQVLPNGLIGLIIVSLMCGVALAAYSGLLLGSAVTAKFVRRATPGRA